MYIYILGRSRGVGMGHVTTAGPLAQVDRKNKSVCIAQISAGILLNSIDLIWDLGLFSI